MKLGSEKTVEPISKCSERSNSVWVLQETEAVDHLVPGAHGFDDGSSLILACCRNCRAALSAYRADHAIDDLISSIRRAAGKAFDVSFGATGAVSHGDCESSRVSGDTS